MLTARPDPRRGTPRLSGVDLSASGESLSYKMTVASVVLVFAMPPLMGSLGELLHFQYSSLHTAASLYLPVLVAITGFWGRKRKRGVRLLELKSLILLGFICGFWLISYFYEMHSSAVVRLSDYDRKRLWFFVHGIFLCGLAGILAAQDEQRFVRLFLRYYCFVAALSSLLYCLSYRPGEQFQRWLGDVALLAGLVAGFGVVSCLSVVLIELQSGRRLSSPVLVAFMGAIGVDVAAILLSGTRGAVLCCGVGAAIFAWMMRKWRLMLPFLVIVAVLAFALVSLANIYVPEATMSMSRLTRREDGLDLRYDLAYTMMDIIAQNPYGKIVGYEYTRLYMDYAHNMLLQYVGEAGLLAVPVLLVLLGGVLRNLVCFRADLHVRALGLFLLPVFAESFSAGAAYDPFPWFLLFFVFSLRGERRKPVPCLDPRPAALLLETPNAPVARRQRGIIASAGRVPPRAGTVFDGS